jgi:hypothetical protein
VILEDKFDNAADAALSNRSIGADAPAATAERSASDVHFGEQIQNP